MECVLDKLAQFHVVELEPPGAHILQEGKRDAERADRVPDTQALYRNVDQALARGLKRGLCFRCPPLLWGRSISRPSPEAACPSASDE
jgi:hypothetical protein